MWSDTAICAAPLAHQRAACQPVSSATVPSTVVQQMSPVIRDSDDLIGAHSAPPIITVPMKNGLSILVKWVFLCLEKPNDIERGM